MKTFTPKMAIVNYLNSLDFLSAGELLKDQKWKEILDVRFHVRLLIYTLFFNKNVVFPAQGAVSRKSR